MKMLPAKVSSQFCAALVLLSLNFITFAYSQNASITIPLNRTLSWADKELYGDFVNLNATSTLEVKLTDVNKNVSYIIFQVHSYLYNVTLYNNSMVRNSVIIGTNIGLYSSVKPALDTFYIYNQNDVDLKIYVTVHGYDTSDPIPGGCNMEYPTVIAPYMQTTVNKDFVLVDAAPARDLKDPSCKSLDTVTVVFYSMYLPWLHLDVDTYFEAIQKMSTLDQIVNNGGFIPENGENMRRRLAAYPSMGAVYVAIAYSTTNKSAYSVYVPKTAYTCNPAKEGDCNLLHDALSIALCLLLCGVGFVMCFFGHYFFKTEMFLIGSLSGVIITYIVISLIATVDPPALLGASLLSGVGFGAIWLLFWWFYGIPLLSVLLPTLNVGFLFAAIIYYSLPGGLAALQVDINFWMLFVTITLLTSLMLVSMTFLSNILCCAILGSYASVYAMSYIVGSNLHYIVINTVRRAVVPKFNKAILAPPFGWQESFEIALWTMMAVTGFVVQHRLLRGRPPFPPPPRSVRPSMPGLSYGAIRGAINMFNSDNLTRDGTATNTRDVSSANDETAPLLA